MEREIETKTDCCIATNNNKDHHLTRLWQREKVGKTIVFYFFFEKKERDIDSMIESSRQI
jgi:hypothetical protein